MIKRMLFAFMMRGFGAFSALIMSVVVTHSASPDDAGMYFLIFAIVSLLATVSRLGYDNAVIKAVAIQMEKNGGVVEVINYAIKRPLLVGSIFFLMFVVFSREISQIYFDRLELSSPLVIGSFCIVFQAMVWLYACALQGMGLINYSILLKNILVPVLVSFFLFFYYFVFGGRVVAETLVFLLVLSQTISLMVAVLLFRKFQSKLAGFSMGTETISGLNSSAKSFFVASCMEVSNLWSAQIVCGMYLSEDMVAYYSSAQRASMAVIFILMAVNAVVAPKFAAMHLRGDWDGIKELARRGTLLTGMVALPVCLLGLFFSELVMRVFGAGFVAAAPVFAVLIIGQLFNGLGGPANQLLMMTGHEVVYRNITVITGTLNIVSLFLVVPVYGIIGAAYVMALVVALESLIKFCYIRVKLGFWVVQLSRNS